MSELNMKNQKTIEEMNQLMKGLTLEELKILTRGRIRFPMYVNSPLMELDIATLDLTVRSYNCLRRASIDTIGTLVERIERQDDLKRLRNCGVKSCEEIMLRLFITQFEYLKPEKRARYMQRVMQLNGIR